MPRQRWTEDASSRPSKGRLDAVVPWRPSSRRRLAARGVRRGEGYGFLPYDYVLKGQAVDWWALLKSEWIDAEAFTG